MPLRTPSWWYAKASVTPALLTPAALIWNLVTRLRWIVAKPYRSRLPVICIGNFTAGGTGKTPAAIAVAHMLRETGQHPVFLTRGYGGTTSGPHLVDPSSDPAQIVGDEPLLLAGVAPTIISADRAEGAKLAEGLKASVIIMDDGFQNPSLAKTLSLIVVDGILGLGNEHVIPAGPLRASLGFQLNHADGIILVGEGDAVDRVQALSEGASLPVLMASIVTASENAWLKDNPVVAFAGIGTPDKFFRTVERAGGRIVGRMAFPDHHPYTPQDALKLLDLASQHGAQLVTTQKDLVRIEGGGELQKLKTATRALPVTLQFKDLKNAKKIITQALGSA